MSNIPLGYLLLVLFLGWCTYFVLAPSHWPRPFRSLDLYFTVINEVPFLALFLLISSTLLAFSQGDLAHLEGKLTFALALIVVGGLLLIIYRGFQAVPAVSRGLDEELGDDWRTFIPAEMNQQLEKKFTAKALLGPFFRRRLDVVRTANIPYGDAGERNLLDVYRHRSASAHRPVFIHLHGGSFMSGRKNSQSLPLLYGLASKDWVCISANYRIGREVKFPEHLIDAKKVIAWVREHAEEYGADPDAIFLAGNSAGAHLAAMAGLTQNDPRFQPDFEEINTTSAGVICQTGYYGSIAKKITAPSSPMAYSSKKAPPFFVVHGDQDKVVPVEQARRFVNHLRNEASSPIVYMELPHATHLIDLFHSLRSEAVFHGIEAFATYVLNKQDLLPQKQFKINEE